MPTFHSSQRAAHRARVLEIREVAPAHYQIRLQSPALARAARPGQFVHILTRPGASDWVFDPLLRRAFSIMSVNEPEKSAVEVLFRAGGRGTKALSHAKINDEIDLLGPLGRPFDLAPFETTGENNELFHVKQNAPHAIVVGGGVGVPPLVYLSQHLRSHGIKVHAIIGARNGEDIIGRAELSAVCEQVAITTDDGSLGHSGRVTDLLPQLIDKTTQKNEKTTVLPVVYSCGPWPMLRGIAHLCAQLEVKCQVSLEENMPCGVGVCNGCVVRVHQRPENLEVDASTYGNYRRVCVEGPACWADEIDWEYQG